MPDPDRPLCRPAAWMVSRHGILAALALVLATLIIFRLIPALDLGAAALFYAGQNRFIGQTGVGAGLRQVFAALPFVIGLGLVGLYAARVLGSTRFWAPSGRGVAFLLLSLAIGPGILVNVVLKDHSHRPRPLQTRDFGGPLPFRPVGSIDGACARNCSFVSGEGAFAFWTLAPVLLMPLPVQPLAMAAAIGFGTAASLLRIAFGGHYLSDTIMAALLIWLVVAGAWRILRPRP